MAAALQLYLGEPETPGDSPDHVEVVERTVNDVFAAYAQARGLAPRTIEEYQVTQRKLVEWRAIRTIKGPSVHRCTTPMHFRELLDRDLLADFLDWVFCTAIEAGAANPGRVHNKCREHLRALLAFAVEGKGWYDSLPRLPPEREQKTTAGLFFLSDDELNALYWATYRMERVRGWDCSQPIGAYWRGALAVFLTYGVDTQLVFRMDKRAEPLRWRNVFASGLPPDRSSRQESEHGWLAWSRQKTGHQFCAPLTAIVAAHLKVIETADRDDESPIFERAGGGRPCLRFQELVGLARIAPKLDPITGAKVSWTIKDLRKTAATRHEENMPGSSSLVLGHSDGGMANVTRKHYVNPGPVLFRAISTLPYPLAFRSILDDSIRPPHDLLFAK